MSASCPICGSTSSTEFFHARHQPAMLNRLLPTREEALKAKGVDLRFLRCDDLEHCGFVWNAAFDADSVRYAPGYINDQSQSPAFRAHLDQVRSRIAAMIQHVEGEFLEIGCGQGDFLHQLCDESTRNGIGFDPALDDDRPTTSPSRDDGAANHSGHARERTWGAGVRVQLHRGYFDQDAAHSLAASLAAIVCRHVLEHIPQPKSILQHAFNAATDRTVVYIEVPCVEWIIEHGAFFDLFNEHCSLFSPRSLHRALRETGFTHIRIERDFGGQYLTATATIAETADRDAEVDESLAMRSADHAKDSLTDARNAVDHDLRDLLGARPCLIWGAGAKGVSLVNHLRLDAARVPALIDIHPLKRNRFVPITGQQVIAPSDIPRSARDASPLILVMNPNYLGEIRRTLVDLRIDAEVRVMDWRPRVALHR